MSFSDCVESITVNVRLGPLSWFLTILIRADFGNRRPSRVRDLANLARLRALPKVPVSQPLAAATRSSSVVASGGELLGLDAVMIGNQRIN